MNPVQIVHVPPLPRVAGEIYERYLIPRYDGLVAYRLTLSLCVLREALGVNDDTFVSPASDGIYIVSRFDFKH